MITKKIFKKDIAIELIKRGHTILYTEPNLKKSWLLVFNFLETEELLRDMTEINNKNS